MKDHYSIVLSLNLNGTKENSHLSNAFRRKEVVDYTLLKKPTINEKWNYVTITKNSDECAQLFVNILDSYILPNSKS